MSGWKPGEDKFIKTHELFVTIWRKLQDEADINNDGLVTAEEWVGPSFTAISCILETIDDL